MTFSVTFRRPDGALKTESIEAANRGDCFAIYRNRGISPISVKECTERRKKGSTVRLGGVHNGNGFPVRLRGLVFMVAGLSAIGLGIWYWVAHSTKVEKTEQKPFPEKRNVSVKDATPVKAPKPAEIPVAKESEPLAKKKLTLEEREAIIEKRIMETPLDFSAKTNRAFSTGLEQKLAAIFATELGAPPPLMPTKMSPVTYLRLQEILDAPNEILETDSERVVVAKQACAEAKKMMKEHIAAGGDPENFLESYYSLLKQASDEWKAAQMQLIETMRTDPGLAATMESEINENFAARGIRPVKMPPKMKERYGIK